jgi:hypothetical protein
MSIDPTKWLEALKSATSTAGVYKLALAVICGLYWLAASRQWIPSAEPLEFRVAALGLFLFGFLWLANVLSSLLSIFQPREWFVHWINIRRQTREVRDYIPHMTPTERAIIAYLLARNQKSFVAAADGGNAMLLLSRAIVVRALAPGQVFYETDMPMMIPDHIWHVLESHKDQFPYTPPPDGELEPHPWRVHWMEH